MTHVATCRRRAAGSLYSQASRETQPKRCESACSLLAVDYEAPDIVYTERARLELFRENGARLCVLSSSSSVGPPARHGVHRRM